MDWNNISKVAIGAFCYSTLIIFTRLTSGLDAMQIAFFRAFFAFLFFCLLLIRFREPLDLLKYKNKVVFLIGAGIAMGVTAALYIYAVQHTTAANAALLVNSAPIYIAFLAPWLLKEERPRYTWLSLGLILVGIILITQVYQSKIDLNSLNGIFAGIISGFTYALTMLFSRYLRKSISGFTQTFWSTGVASLLLLPWVFQAPTEVILKNLPILIPLGIISLGIASFLYFIALSKLKAQVVSIVAILEPVSGVLIGFLMFGEPLTLTSLIGSLLVLTSIYLISK
jgi:drug/metabolite transporter (DMT)-like permease